MIKKIMIGFGLSVFAGVSTITTVSMLDESHEYCGAPEPPFGSFRNGVIVIALGPIGTLIAGIRWLYYWYRAL
jgi:hypothetical protein